MRDQTRTNELTPAEIEERKQILLNCLKQARKTDMRIKVLPDLDFRYTGGFYFSALIDFPPMLMSLFKEVWIDARVKQSENAQYQYVISFGWRYKHPERGGNGYNVCDFFAKEDGTFYDENHGML